MTTHWATDLIGKPYRLGGQGPDEFDCWGFVRWCFIHHLGVVDMPIVHVGETTNAAIIRDAAVRSGWRPVKDNSPQVDDIILMDGIEGKHVGIISRVNGLIVVLHSITAVGVCSSRFSELGYMGFRNFSLWRKE